MSLTISVDSFTSISDADSYWTNNSGGTAWASASQSDKEAALRQASQYIDKRYKFIGMHTGSVSQLLAWPRVGAVDKQGRYRSGVPKEIKDATAYLANEALSEHLLPPQQRGNKIKRLRAGGTRHGVEIDYQPNAPGQTTYDYVDLLVSDLIVGSRNSSKMMKL